MSSTSIQSSSLGGGPFLQQYVVAANTFSIGNAIRRTNGGWALSQANLSDNSDVYGIVVYSTASVFVVATSGVFPWAAHGFNIGDILYLSASTAGGLQNSDPGYPYVSKPVAVVSDSNNLLMLNSRGLVTSAPNTTSPSFRNRIINGDMRIDQRNNGSSVTPTNNQYVLDRYVAWRSNTTQTVTFQQSTVAPAGFSQSMAITAISGAATAATDITGFFHRIEGYNVADFVGTSAAVTLSFWIRSSVTGVYSIRFSDYTAPNYYVATYTVLSANTWEKKSITVPWYVNASAEKTNAASVELAFCVSSGSTYQGGTPVWSSANASLPSASGQANAMATTGNVVYFTGIQFEVGSTATVYENLPIQIQMSQCQRYYETGLGDALAGTGYVGNRSFFKVTKRATPTVTTPSVSGGSYSSFQVDIIGLDGFRAYAVGSGSSNIDYTWTATAEL